MVITRGSGGGGAAPTYAEILRDTYGASEIWPLVNIASGTTISAFINSARNGTETGWDLQNAAGPVTGTLAPFSGGAGDFGNIYSSGGGVGLADILNGQEIALFAFFKANSAAVWSDATIRTIFELRAPGTNYAVIRKSSTSNQLNWFYGAGGVLKSGNITYSGTGWGSFGLRASKAGDLVQSFIDGAPSTSATGLGNFTGALSSNLATIGAFNASTPTLIWHGWLAYAAVWFGSGNLPSDAEFAAMHAAAATAGPDV